MSHPPKAHDVKVFVPAKDFSLSLAFYKSLGWKENWNHENGLAELELADKRFYLQNYYQKDWAENFMIYIDVDNAQSWYVHVSQLIENHPEYQYCRVTPPKVEAHGIITYVWDPSGVLLHFAEGKP